MYNNDLSNQRASDNGTKPMLAAVGDVVSFRYKGGRFVKGEVTWINKNGLGLILQTDYLGKNVDWYVGEKKDFNLSECEEFNNWSSANSS